MRLNGEKIRCELKFNVKVFFFYYMRPYFEKIRCELEFSIKMIFLLHAS